MFCFARNEILFLIIYLPYILIIAKQPQKNLRLLKKQEFKIAYRTNNDIREEQI